ncbi:MAG TPA: phosphoglucosamine mutase [Gaiellaceae bacterium]|nr:phosphoglucosamine mutase [Gaiellaceae bacterium]
MRRYFGTDGVRGVVGREITPALVERLGRAATLWRGGGGVLIGRDTRASGRELERAFASGVASAGGNAMLAGVLPTPAVALLALDLGAVISASHNPPEYNGVKLFDGDGQKLTDEAEEEIEALLGAAPRNMDEGRIDNLEVAIGSYRDHVTSRFGTDLDGLRIGVDCANGAYSGIAPKAFANLGAQVKSIGDKPDGENINVGCGATDLRALQQLVTREALDFGVAFDGDGDRMLAVDEKGEAVDGDQILAVLALELDVELVAVTTMANLGLHRLLEGHGIRVVTTDVGDRYVLEALRRESGVLGGEQSGHLIYLDGHVTGDGLVAALLLCRALRGRKLSETVAVMERFPQVTENVSVPDKRLTPAIHDAVETTNAELAGRGRVLVRPSGTEPVVRVLAEAENEAEARKLCGTIAALVSKELG